MIDEVLLLDVLETTKRFVQCHPHDKYFMLRILLCLHELNPKCYPREPIDNAMSLLTQQTTCPPVSQTPSQQ